MLGAGYLFVPSPGATPVPMPAAKSAAANPPSTSPAVPPSNASAVPPSKPANTLVANRPPVPLVAPAHHNYFTLKEPKEAPKQAATKDGAPVQADTDKATADKGTSTAKAVSSDAGAEPKSADTQQAFAADAKSGNDAKAKAAVEQDGYKNVRDLVKNADGTWRGRAMRGRTEIAIRVNADGSVSQD